MTALFSMGAPSPQLKDERRFATMAGPAKTRKAPTTTRATPGPGDAVEGSKKAGDHEGDAEKAVASVPRKEARMPVATVSALVKTTCANTGLGLRQHQGAKGQARRATCSLRMSWNVSLCSEIARMRWYAAITFTMWDWVSS